MKRRSLVREAPMTNGPIADALAHLGPGAVKQAKKLFENKGDTMTIHTRKREESVERRCEGTEDVVLTITGRRVPFRVTTWVEVHRVPMYLKTTDVNATPAADTVTEGAIGGKQDVE